MPDNIQDAYEIIARHIISNRGQCVLILGPELLVNKSGQGHKTAFREMLPPDSKSRYLDSENLFYFADNYDSNTVMVKALRYYEEAGDPNLLELVSRIKFPLVINVCPDKSLNKVYRQKSIDFKEGYFIANSKDEFKSLPTPTKDLPVLYNVFGSIDLESTLILTHAKLYETIEYLLPQMTLPDNLEIFLRNVRSFIFLGFKFDSWYYQLICHKLRIKTSAGDGKTSLSTPYLQDNENVSILMHSSFDMKFATESPFECIQNIIKTCEAERPGDLRGKSATGHYATFVSYAWSDSTNPQRANIVELIQQELDEPSPALYQLFRDKEEMNYGDSIDSFMTRIGTGKTVILVITDKYLRSIYCMREAYRVYKNKKEDHRVFPILVEGQGEHLLAKSADYKKYWLQQCQVILDDPSRLESGHYDDYVSIYRFIEWFMLRLADTISLVIQFTDVIQDAPTQKYAIVSGKAGDYRGFMDRLTNKLQED